MFPRSYFLTAYSALLPGWGEREIKNAPKNRQNMTTKILNKNSYYSPPCLSKKKHTCSHKVFPLTR